MLAALHSIVSSNLFQKYVLVPLAVIGLYQIFRGITQLLSRDIEEKHLTGWTQKIYIVITILGCIVLVFSPKRQANAHDDPYTENYGSHSSVNDEYSNSYEDNANDNETLTFNTTRAIIERAENYAHQQTGWSVYEAMQEIGANNGHMQGDSTLTETEYEEVVDTLYFFYEHLNAEISKAAKE